MFDEIYNYYFPRITIYVGRKYKDHHFGEDIAHEFFMKLFRITLPEKVEYPTIWIFKSCDNLAKTHLKRKGPVVLPLHEEAVAATQYDFENEDLPTGISEESMAALRKLDSDTIEIFVMLYWEGFNLKEIAEKMGIDHATVRKKASRGHAKLKKFLLSGHTLTIMLGLLG